MNEHQHGPLVGLMFHSRVAEIAIHFLLMNKNDQQNCGGEEQHSNLDLIKKIQAQISILEKNSN